MSETRKWVDLYPGKQHEFGTRVRLLGHARMNDGAVRLYYEEIELTNLVDKADTGANRMLPGPMIQESEQTTIKKPEKSGGKKEK